MIVREIPENLIPKDFLMIGPWASAIQVFLKNQGCLQQYRYDTQDFYEPKTCYNSLMRSQECVEDYNFLIRFIKWFNANHWDIELKAG